MQTEWQTVQTLISSLIWVCTVCPDLSVRKLRIITVVTVCPSILSPDTYFNFFFQEVIHVHYYAIHEQTMVPQCRQREYMWSVDLSLRKPKGQGCWLQPTEDCLTYFNDVSSLKAVELKKLCTIHGIDETYPKKKCNPPDFKYYPRQLTDENFPHMV